MEEKIKYVLNGTTKYYELEELKDYYRNLLKNNNVYFEENFEIDIQSLLKILKKYDGDPYGWIIEKRTWKMHHEFEEEGGLIILR